MSVEEPVSTSDAIANVARLVDAAGDAKAVQALDEAEAALDALAVQPLAAADQARLHYYRANLWSHRSRLANERTAWSWKQPARERELLELRRAVRHAGFAKLEPLVAAQTLTNLANNLNALGRFIEAVETWDRALTLVPRLGMARGNRGIGLTEYARAVYDPGHAALLLHAAWNSLRSSVAPDALVESQGLDEAFRDFRGRAKAIEAAIDVKRISRLDLTTHSLGTSKAERQYRQWCLEKRLFLSPLNDIGPYPIAAHDVLSLPGITVRDPGIAEMPDVIRYFNLMKQEYVSARFTLFEGLSAHRVHYADRGVLLFNTLDYPALSLGVEWVKMAFRSAYAIFDKTAFLLNTYFGLGHGERRVNFRNLWFESRKKDVLHSSLDGIANWPLRGLFWLSKDIFEDDFKSATEPDAEQLYELRNHLEHKFVSVHHDFFGPAGGVATGSSVQGVQALTFDVLVSRSLRMLKLARCALIYVSLAIHSEERRRHARDDGCGLTMTMEIDVWEDRWKRPM